MKCAIETCNAGATKSGYCFWHDPNIDEETKQAARSRGGRNSRPVQPWQLPEQIQPVNDVQDLKRLYNSCLGWLTQGLISPSQAHAVRAIAAGLKDALELELIENLSNRRLELTEILESHEVLEVGQWPLLQD